uniref:Transposase n=1 Tax=Vespula pensylvanica TaxID=30213 RepID=A0A834UEB0_VESPE|nr:hypothetical protein H0235_003005 [Vespula pensylvanica]
MGSLKSKNVRMTKLKMKTMLVVFLDPLYIGCHQWKKKDFFLLHDNALVHRTAAVAQFLGKKQVSVFNHPPYSLDLAPSNFFLFPKIEIIL